MHGHKPGRSLALQLLAAVLPLVASWSVPSVAAAQAVLTRQAAVDEALARNPELAAMRVGLDAERLRPARQQLLAPPMVDARIWQWPTDTLDPGKVTYMLTAEQSIPGPGKRALRTALADADVHVSSARVAARAIEVAADVRRTYAALFLARESTTLTGDRLELLRQMAEASQIRYAAGRTSQQDVLKAIVEISRLHEEQIVNEERIRSAEARLNTLLARDPGSPVPPLEAPRELPDVRPLPDLQQAALDAQPELVVARAEIARAEAAAAVADGERRPDFVVSGGYMWMPGERDALTGSVGITWPNAPWSRKGVDLARQEAQTEIAAARARCDALASRVRLMVAEAYIRAESARRRAALLRTSVVPQSGQALDVSRVGYQADRSEFLEIVDNQRVLAEARLGYLRALAELDDARADLERAVGSSAILEQGR